MPLGMQLSQQGFRFRNDDGDDITATWKAAINVVPEIALDTPFRLRTLVHRIDSGTTTNTKLHLYSSYNGGPDIFVDDPGTKVISAASIHYAHAADTTQQLGSATYVSDNNNMCNDTGSSGTLTWPVPTGSTNEVEHECNIIIPSAGVSDGDTIAFRLQDSVGFVFHSDVGAYNEVPIITILKPGIHIRGGTVAIHGGTIQLR